MLNGILVPDGFALRGNPGALRSADDLLQSFVRWRKAGVWDRLPQAVSEAYDGDIVMIDSTCVRVHQHAATGKKGMETMEAWDVPAAGLRAKSTRSPEKLREKAPE